MRNKILILLLFIPFIVSAQDGYYFFTESEINNMRSAAKTEWGQKIIKTLKDTVDSRRKFQLHVPLLEGGHIHDYFSTGISRKNITVHNASIIGQGISVTTGHG